MTTDETPDAPADVAPATEAPDDDFGDHDLDDLDDGESSEVQGWRQWVPGWRLVAVGVAVLALAALLSGSAYLIVQHQRATAREQRAETFTTGARQGVVNLMGLNFNTGQADLQRVMDSTTGAFHDDFDKTAKDFLTVMKDAKVVTTTTVSATGVESMTDDSATVLVATTSQVANSASQQPTPRTWRLAVTVNDVNGQIKMSKVEFVP